jgi:predicted nucleic acid-binding protein
MNAVLDTSVVIASDIDPLGGELAISGVTLAELQFGVSIATQPEGARRAAAPTAGAPENLRRASPR